MRPKVLSGYPSNNEMRRSLRRTTDNRDLSHVMQWSGRGTRTARRWTQQRVAAERLEVSCEEERHTVATVFLLICCLMRPTSFITLPAHFSSMGVMSDLHLLSERVLKGETVQSVAEDSTYDREDIAWATAERLRKS